MGMKAKPVSVTGENSGSATRVGDPRYSELQSFLHTLAVPHQLHCCSTGCKGTEGTDRHTQGWLQGLPSSKVTHCIQRRIYTSDSPNVPLPSGPIYFAKATSSKKEQGILISFTLRHYIK